MEDASDAGSQPPRPKKPRESLSEEEKCIRSVLESGGKAEKSAQRFVPTNTERTDRWAVKAFTSWISERNQRSQGETCPEDILDRNDSELLNKWLSVFVLEVRRENGSRYLPASLRLLLSGLLRHMRRNSVGPVHNLLDKNDVRFHGLRLALEAVEQTAPREGSGVKRLQYMTEAEENHLWNVGILGCETPQALLLSVLFQNGRHLGIRGGKEHRQLSLSQFSREDDHWKFTEMHGDVAQLRRVIRRYPCASLGKRCHVYLLDLYMERLPQDAKGRDAFYFSPLQFFSPEKGQPWFSAIPIGKNKLDRLMKDSRHAARLDDESPLIAQSPLIDSHSLHADHLSPGYTQQPAVPPQLKGKTRSHSEVLQDVTDSHLEHLAPRYIQQPVMHTRLEGKTKRQSEIVQDLTDSHTEHLAPRYTQQPVVHPRMEGKPKSQTGVVQDLTDSHSLSKDHPGPSRASHRTPKLVWCLVPMLYAGETDE